MAKKSQPTDLDFNQFILNLKQKMKKLDDKLSESKEFSKNWKDLKSETKKFLIALDIDKNISLVTVIKRNILLVVIWWLFNKVIQIYLQCWDKSNGNMAMALFNAIPKLPDIFLNPFPSFYSRPLLYSLVITLFIKCVVAYRRLHSKNFRVGEEYGSARWGTAEDIKPFIDPIPERNILLTQTERITISNRSTIPKNARNNNVLVVGGSGSGKTRFYIKPNLMQMHSSYVVTDPKGTLVLECGKMLANNGYNVKVFNTVNFAKSLHYNPFKYIKSEKDILKLVNTLILNTKGEGDKSGEDFWVKAEKLFYQALIGYMYYALEPGDQNFRTLIKMLDNSKTSEDDENYINGIDELFTDMEKEYGAGNFAVRQYKKYKLAAGKTAKSILISCGARLAPFDIEEMNEITSYDELDLDMIGDEKTALFIIISDTDTTFNFIVSILYSQMFNLLCDRADDVYSGRLPIHVRCLLDEFANIGQIPNFDKLIATIRSREISASIVLQSKSQLKAIYRDNADTIEGNCDSVLFLGGKEKTTLKELAEAMGKETIDLMTDSRTRSNQESYQMNYQKTGKELMSQDELAAMDGSKCILQIRGLRPFFSDKFDITKHKQYKNLSDFDKKNEFNLETNLKRKTLE